MLYGAGNQLAKFPQEAGSRVLADQSRFRSASRPLAGIDTPDARPRLLDANDQSNSAKRVRRKFVTYSGLHNDQKESRNDQKESRVIRCKCSPNSKTAPSIALRAALSSILI